MIKNAILAAVAVAVTFSSVAAARADMADRAMARHAMHHRMERHMMHHRMERHMMHRRMERRMMRHDM